MAITAQDIAKLRSQTGAGMMDCKAALEESNGDFDSAVDLLRKKGAAKAAKRAGKIASEGKVFTYNHGEGRIGVILELNSETDFVAQNEKFLALGNDLCMHVAAMAPKFLSREEVTAEDVEREKNVYREQLKDEGKPEEMIEKILEGKMNKYYEEVCLMKQLFIKDDKVTIEGLINQIIAKTGEKIEIGNFARYQI